MRVKEVTAEARGVASMRSGRDSGAKRSFPLEERAKMSSESCETEIDWACGQSCASDSGSFAIGQRSHLRKTYLA